MSDNTKLLIAGFALFSLGGILYFVAKSNDYSIFRMGNSSSKRNTSSPDNTEVSQLRRENESLRSINKDLHQRLRDLTALSNNDTNSDEHPIQSFRNASNTPSMRLTEISKVQLEAYVEKLLDDPKVNSNYIPDFVEESIYRNALGMVLNLLDHILETTKIELLGHQLKLDIQSPPSDTTSIDHNREATPIPDQAYEEALGGGADVDRASSSL